MELTTLSIEHNLQIAIIRSLLKSGIINERIAEECTKNILKQYRVQLKRLEEGEK